MTTTMPTCDDRPIWDLWLSAYHFYTVTAADELGVFSLLARTPMTTSKIASALELRPRAAEAMLGVLAALGFLVKHGDHFSLTPVSRNYLLADQPNYWGPALRLTQEVALSHQLIRDAIKGNRAMTYQAEHYDMQEGVTSLWKQPEQLDQPQMNADQLRFMAHAMHAHSMPAALGMAATCDFSGVRRLLDIGGGLGGFCVALARQNPHLRCTVAELAPIAAMAQDHIAREGLSEQIAVAPVDMFTDPWPNGHDAIFFSDIFHDWDLDRCRLLAQKSYEALPVGGKILLHEMLVSDSKDGPLPAASYSLVMLLTTQGHQFTASEMTSLLETSGFAQISMTQTFGYFSLISATKA